MNLGMDKRKERCPVCDGCLDVAILTDVDCNREFLICYNCNRHYFRYLDEDSTPMGEWVFVGRFGKSEGIDLNEVLCNERKRKKS